MLAPCVARKGRFDTSILVLLASEIAVRRIPHLDMHTVVRLRVLRLIFASPLTHTPTHAHMRSTASPLHCKTTTLQSPPAAACDLRPQPVESEFFTRLGCLQKGKISNWDFVSYLYLSCPWFGRCVLSFISQVHKTPSVLSTECLSILSEGRLTYLSTVLYCKLYTYSSIVPARAGTRRAPAPT